MPIYEYECKLCNHTWEVLAKLSDLEPTQCPACGESNRVTEEYEVKVVQKKVSQNSFQLQGSGWYRDGY